MTTARAAVLQARWTGDAASMTEVHESYARAAAEQGTQVMGFQEVFNAPYLCQVQEAEHHRWAEPVPDGPTVVRMQALARETGMVPVFEREDAGHYYNTAAVIDARHFPEGRRAPGPAGAQIVFDPGATSRGLSSYPWKLEQPAAAVADEYVVAAIDRVGVEEYGDHDFHGTSYVVDPRGRFVGEPASAHDEELVVRDLDLDVIDEMRQQWAFYRDRRPDSYGSSVGP